MRRTQRILLASLLASFCSAQALAQTPLDARAVRPAVMLLVDTSGSMERLPVTASTAGEGAIPMCTGNTAQDNLQKNRWAMTIEALTGSFQNYTCSSVDRSTYPATDYDYGYYLPHIDFGTSPPQNTDGILDSFSNRVKFGLMTFDGVPTTINGDTLVPYSTWSNQAYLDQVNGAPGLYSYGRVGRLSFPGCVTDYGVNAGARGPGSEPGALISVGISDNVDDIRAVNARIQSSLLEVRPFGGTPIPAMLDDLEYYIHNNPDIRSASDSLYACRKRVGILITDGAPDALFRDSRFQCDSATQNSCAAVSGSDDTTTTCECPYDTAENIAARLIDPGDGLLEKLIVVAYNVHDTAALDTLEGIARSGWPATQLPPKSNTDSTRPYLIQADGPVELRDKLDQLLDESQPDVTSRSVPISVTTGDLQNGANSKRFDITAGFRLGENTDQPWSGFLYRRRVLCGGSDGTTVDDSTPFEASAGDEFHTILNNRSPATRDLFTATPQLATSINGTLRNFDYRPVPVYTTDSSNFDSGRLTTSFITQNDRRPDGSTFSLSDQVAPDSSSVSTQGLWSDAITPRVSFDNNLSVAYFGDADSNGVPGTTQDRARIVDYVRGDSRRDRVLADIYHSNPVALRPINSVSTDRFNDINASYSDWLRKLIASGSGSHYGADGRPGVVFVGTNDGVLHAFNLDDWRDASGNLTPGGTELWGFIPPALFGKLAAAAAPAHQFMFDGTPQVKDVVLQKKATTPAIFRTILVSAVRGAPAFVALDVTMPEAPVFLWQVSFPDVGETVGNPALTQVLVNWRGELQQRAVAILPGGAGVAAASCPSTGQPVYQDRTRAYFPAGNNRNVRCWQRRGRSLYVVDIATGQLIQSFGPEHFPSPLTGSVAVDTPGVGTSSAAYFFDHDGILWRLSMTRDDPSLWRAAPLYDMFNNPTIVTPPAPQQPLATWQAGRVPQYAPVLTRDGTGNLVILAGTGEVDNPLDTAIQRVVSLTELRTLDTSDGQIEGTIRLNWQLDLGTNESVTGPLNVFEKTAYFATFTSMAGANQCALGESRIYGLAAYDAVDPGATPPAPEPALLPANAQVGDTPVAYELVEGGGSNLVLGLTITRQPICRSPISLVNAVTQQTVPGGPPGGGLYELKGMMAGSSSGGRMAGGSVIRETNARVVQAKHPSTVTAWAGSVE
jgi:type IV pilus assembly protein PilY1